MGLPLNRLPGRLVLCSHISRPLFAIHSFSVSSRLCSFDILSLVHAFRSFFLRESRSTPHILHRSWSLIGFICENALFFTDNTFACRNRLWIHAMGMEHGSTKYGWCSTYNDHSECVPEYGQEMVAFAHD